MSRITTVTDDPLKPRLEKSDVMEFFKERASKVATLGATRAVIYQDKHPDLAEKRDVAEKARLLPLLQPHANSRVLDIGCGTGRWTSELASRSLHYHGIDFSPELIDCASELHKGNARVRFSVASAESYSLESLREAPFDRILCCGVLIYLNDEDVVRALRCMVDAAAPQARILLREPVATADRLSIIRHFSEELEQDYNAIYRTENELREAASAALGDSGFQIIDSGNVYLDAQLNNRTETVQRWLAMERT